MYKVINDYMSKMNMMANSEITGRISGCLSDISEITKYTLSVNFMRYILDIYVKDFDVSQAASVFCKIQNAISYPYSSFHVRYNEGKCVRYRFLTCKENKDGFYCDIVIH